MTSRREFIVSAAAAGTITMLPFRAGADGHAVHSFKAAGGELAVHPVSHASFVMTTPMGTIYVDPVGEAAGYADKPAPDLILVTHRHGDHFSADLLKSFGDAPIVTNSDVQQMMDVDLAARAKIVGHGGAYPWNGAKVGAIPAYNLDPASKFHPKERGDNGYVLNLGGFRIYISGDTEDIPEMRALQDIHLAFVCMNLPFTMTDEAAASAVAEFKPKFVYPLSLSRARRRNAGSRRSLPNLSVMLPKCKLVDWYPGNDAI